MDAKTRYKAKKIKAVFFDIDDTLRVKETGYMPESIRTAFEQLKTKGIVTGIASGRALFGVVPDIRDLQPDYFVTVNGACGADSRGQMLFENPIPTEWIESYVAWCQEVGIAYGLVGQDKAVLSERHDWIDEAMVPVYGELEVEPDFYKDNPVYQLFTFDKDSRDLTLPEDLAADLRLVRWHPYSCDVVKHGISKASGVARILDSLKLKAENLLVFGDEKNDLEIFEYAGLAVAMGNAVDEVKSLADYVTNTVEEDGILKALEALGMIDKTLHFPQLELETVDGPVATIKTNHGDMVLKLFPEHAPKTVANFVALAKNGYYDGVIFHRIINDFMIQGGDPTGTGEGGESIYGPAFEDEFSEELYHLRGALSMANAGPNTNGSQFFIVQNKHLAYNAKELKRGGWPEPIAKRYTDGGTPHLDRRHTVFGQLVDEASFEVLDKIAGVETGFADRPIEEVVIESIEVVD